MGTTGPARPDRRRACRTGHPRPRPHAPHLGETAPIPLLALAQLFTRDVPGLAGPDGCDLLQVLWCPFESHGPRRNAFDVVLTWRRSADVTDVLPAQPEPAVIGRAQGLPNPCVLHPEQVTEHEYIELLDDELLESVEEWEEDMEEAADDATDGAAEPGGYATYEEYEAAMRAAERNTAPAVSYTGDLSIAPGWKAGGFASWHLTGPTTAVCAACGTPMRLLLTAADREWDTGTESWVPVEDRESMNAKGANTPTGVSPARGTMHLLICPDDPDHPHHTVFQ
ncbi:hypothetical protein ABZ714_00965 [Streptomyces sp. NPDC006798]|uniref:hypothetical protein n=1 Tax=Streptomyces sp. NPDC006798 TaxID=3155462 RepID=UPI00340A6AF1